MIGYSESGLCTSCVDVGTPPSLKLASSYGDDQSLSFTDCSPGYEDAQITLDGLPGPCVTSTPPPKIVAP